MVTIELYKNCVFNNASRMSNFADFSAQKSYFDSYPTSDKLTLTDVKFYSLFQPVLINEDLSDMFEYVYGRIDFGTDGQNQRRYVFFSVNHFEIVTQNKTNLYFDIDWWETYRYPISNGSNGIQIGRARLNRCSLNLSYRLYNQFHTVSKEIIKVQDLTVKYQSVNDKLNCVFLLYHDNNGNEDWVYIVIFDKTKNSASGFDLSALGPLNKDSILSAWYSPFSVPKGQLASLPFVTTIVDSLDTTGLSGYKCKLRDLSVYLSNNNDAYPVNPFNREYDFSNTVTDANWVNEYQEIGFTDLKGNLVYSYKYRHGVTLPKKVSFKLNISMESASYHGYFGTITTTADVNTMFTIPCEPVTIFGDAFVAYCTQVRPYQEQLRKIQQSEALYTSLANMGSNIIGGGVGGGLATKGSVAGGIAGALGGAVATEISAYANYKIADKFNKQYQYNEDLQASAQTDDLRFSGTALDDCMRGLTGVWLVKIRSDQPSIDAYDKEIASFGYYYDTEISDMETLLSNNATFKVTADCEIENVPAIAEQSIKSRLSAGAVFIRPTWS